MKIEREGVEVEVVNYDDFTKHWEKEVNGVVMAYFKKNGWREVKPPRRDVTGEIEIVRFGRDWATRLNHRGKEDVACEPSYHFEKVPMYDLPEDWHCQFMKSLCSFAQFIDQYKRHCIIITKEE